MWDSETAQVKYTLQSGSKAVSVMTLPNGIVLTGGPGDPKIKLWYRGFQSKEIECEALGFTELPALNAFAVHDAKTFNVDVFSFESYKRVVRYEGHRARIHAVDTLESGELTSCADDSTLIVHSDTL